MGTTADKLNKLLETKEAIKQAIRDKGVYIGDHDAFAEYPDAIRSIEVGGGEEITGSYIIAKFPDDMEEGTDYIKKATELDISHLDISRMRTMTRMFEGYENLTALDLSSWDVRNIENMNDMFCWCNNLQELDIRNFDLNLETDTSFMFEGCNKLHTIRLDNCSNDTINKVVTSSNFPTDAIEGVTRKIYVNPDNIKGSTPPINWIFVDSDGNELIPETPEKPGLTVYQEGEYRDNREITEVYTLVTKEHTDLSEMFLNCENLQTINGIEQWDTSNVTDMHNMFESCRHLRHLDLRSFDMSNVRDTMNMFGGCDELKVLRLDNCDYTIIDNIIHSSGLSTGDIYSESRLMYVQEANIINPDNKGERLTAPEGWKFVYVAGNPQDTYDSDSQPFREDRDIQEVNVAVTNEHDDLSHMFECCENLEVIHNIDTWDISNVTDMGDMFKECRKLIYLDLSSWKTKSINDMSSMFERCSHLIYLDIRNFNISDSTERRNMFGDCGELQVLRLDNCIDYVIERIINDTNLPTGDIDGRLRKMYIPEKYATNPEENGLTAPDGWEFAFVEAKKE